MKVFNSYVFLLLLLLTGSVLYAVGAEQNSIG